MSDWVREREAVAELLPFHVNGTLRAEDEARVQAALVKDPTLAGEIEELKALAARLQDLRQEASPGQLGLARLNRELDAERRAWWPMSRLAAAFVLGGGAVWALLAVEAGYKEPIYVQAGAATGGRMLAVAFTPDARSDAITDLLLANDALIVDGPSALGLYRIGVSGDADLAATAATLGAASAVVESVDILE